MSETATTDTNEGIMASVDVQRSSVEAAVVATVKSESTTDPIETTASTPSSTNKRKHEDDETVSETQTPKEDTSSALQTSKTTVNDDQLGPSSPPKKPATAKQNLVAELDETSAKELKVKTVLDQVSIMSNKKLEQLKSLHSGCVGMISEELYLERNLAYVDYTKWVAPQHLLNRDKLDYLNSKVIKIYNILIFFM